MCPSYEKVRFQGSVASCFVHKYSNAPKYTDTLQLLPVSVETLSVSLPTLVDTLGNAVSLILELPRMLLSGLTSTVSSISCKLGVKCVS